MSLNRENKESLANYIGEVWKANSKEMHDVRKEMLKILRICEGKYSNKKLSALAKIRSSKFFVRMLEGKARAGTSWLREIYQWGEEKPWELRPTPSPELPERTLKQIEEKVREETNRLQAEAQASGQVLDPEETASLLQEYYEDLLDEERRRYAETAAQRCERAALLIHDQNVEADFDKALHDFLYYFTRMPFAVLKGPVATYKKKMVWVPDGDGFKLAPEYKAVPTVYAPSPFNVFFSPGAKDIDTADIIELHRIHPSVLSKMRGLPNYDNDEIDAIINRYESGEIKHNWLQVDDDEALEAQLKQKSGGVLCLEFTGMVRGRVLKEWGIEEGIEENSYYQANCWMVDRHVFKAVVNPTISGRKPYFVSSWSKNPERLIGGESLIQIGMHIADILNTIVRSLANNIAIASGPLQEIDRDRVDDRNGLYPWATYYTSSNKMRSEGPAINYYQAQMHVQELVYGYQFFARLLDELTVPAYTMGASQSGVTTGTATVFTQLLAAASRSVKAAVSNIDKDVISKYIEMCYERLLSTSKNMEYLGDVEVRAGGVTKLQAAEKAAQRKVEMLQLALHPTLTQLLGPENMSALVANVAEANEMPLPDLKRMKDPELWKKIEGLITALNTPNAMKQEAGQVLGQMQAGGGGIIQPENILPNGAKQGVVS